MRISILLTILLTLILTTNPAIAAPSGQDADGEVYIVQADDWLSKIAQKTYGDIFAYPVIVEATNAKAAEDSSFATITNPDVIEVGQKLWLPAQAIPLVVDLADGSTCLHAGFGATLAFDGKRLNYTCQTGSDEAQVGLLGELQKIDDVLMGEKVVIGRQESGFFIKESEMVPVSSVSYTAPDPRVQVLRNMTYQGIYQEPVQLTEGKYEGEPFVEGGASRPTVTLLDDFIAFGDLNGDGLDEAAVILAENSGGSGTFIYLALIMGQKGALANVATQLLGDRVQPKALSIEAGEIVATTVTHGPDDPLCCPSQEATLRYQLIDGKLAEQ